MEHYDRYSVRVAALLPENPLAASDVQQAGAVRLNRRESAAQSTGSRLIVMNVF
jgi:hypothetical protein